MRLVGFHRCCETSTEDHIWADTTLLSNQTFERRLSASAVSWPRAANPVTTTLRTSSEWFTLRTFRNRAFGQMLWGAVPTVHSKYGFTLKRLDGQAYYQR